jgi:hypothetical protein
MTLHDLLRFAFENLRRAKLRNTLTIIGVGVGTAALVSMLAYGSGLQKTFTDEFSDLELFNTVRISPTSNEFASLVNFSNRVFKGEKKKESNLVVLTPEVLKKSRRLRQRSRRIRLCIPKSFSRVALHLIRSIRLFSPKPCPRRWAKPQATIKFAMGHFLKVIPQKKLWCLKFCSTALA